MEIGSIFEINISDLFKEEKYDFELPFMKNGNYKYTKKFNSGRSALEYLLRSLNKKSVKGRILVPSYICSSVTDAINRAGYEYDYYKIKSSLKVDIVDLKNRINYETKYILIVHYFGTYSDKNLASFLKEKQKEGIGIIEDIAHSMYTYDNLGIGYGDYVIGSIRKWMAIPDGGFLSSKVKLPNLKVLNGENSYSQNYLAAQIMKHKYINTPNNVLDKNKYLKLNEISIEMLFSDYTIRDITYISNKLIKIYNKSNIINKRKNNYCYLYKGLENIKEIEVLIEPKSNQVPFGFVILAESRDKLFKYLIKNNIFCNIHWKLDSEKLEFDENLRMISDSIITIPCDQRYGKTEMDYIIEKVKMFYLKKRDC